jgi:hypothetical protein
MDNPAPRVKSFEAHVFVAMLTAVGPEQASSDSGLVVAGRGLRGLDQLGGWGGHAVHHSAHRARTGVPGRSSAVPVHCWCAPHTCSCFFVHSLRRGTNRVVLCAKLGFCLFSCLRFVMACIVFVCDNVLY